MKQIKFSDTVNLAEPKFGSRVIYKTDQFFGAANKILNSQKPIFKEGVYDNHGKWMDGWETRRKRKNGHDFLIIKLGRPGKIYNVDIDTSFFSGNQPAQASLQACFSKKNPDIYKKIYSILEKNNRLDFLKCYEIFVNYIDDDSELKKIQTNTLITTGENDVGSTPEMSKNLSKKIANSKVKIVSNGKHLCSIECADDVNNAIKEHIKND